MTEERGAYDGKPGPKGPRRELTLREERFAEGLLQGKKQGEAALDAGYGNGDIARAGHRASVKLADTNFRKSLLARAQERGMGLDYALDGLNRVITGRKAGLTKDGDVVDMGEDPHAQAKGVDMFLKMLGAYPDPRLEIDATVRGAVVVLRESDVIGGDLFSEPAIEGESRTLDN